MRRYNLLFSLLLLAAPMFASAQAPDAIRICTYNLLQFGGDDVDRVDEFRMILNDIRPDILAVQGVLRPSRSEYSGVDLFQDSVANFLDEPLLGYFTMLESPVSISGIFIDTSVIQVLEFGSVHTEGPRPQAGFLLQHKKSRDTLYVITGHWKAGSTSEDEGIRSKEAEFVSTIFAISEIEWTNLQVFAGDLNVYSSDEEAYQTILEGSGTPGSSLVDPLNTPGTWHNNESLSWTHTQSTRVRQFGGGASGGLDERFDQILATPGMIDRMVPNTYTAFGNDGRHFNDSVNAQPNTAVVSTEMAQALHEASDHLPVFVDFIFRGSSSVNEERVAPTQLDLSSLKQL